MVKYSLRRRELLHFILRKRFLVVVILCLVAYNLLPMILFKIPEAYIGWRDKDFQPNPEEGVVILHWTRFFREYTGSPKIFTVANCSYTKPSSSITSLQSPKMFQSCRITYDRRYLTVSDALVFHSFDLMIEDVPKTRSPHQLWVYEQAECPIYTKLNLQAYANVFNWTMSYRKDSDVYHPYGQIVRRDATENHLPINGTRILSQKSKLVAWIVSSCDSYSKREHFVAELQDYVPVDVYGWCGESCPNDDCYSHVGKTYKFYLSFENSLCKDYITEKFFNAMRLNVVPIVYGGRNSVDYSDIAPAKSYIDTRNFKSAQELAMYLLYLDKEEKEYLEYFQWKVDHKVIASQGWCNICQKVHERKEKAKQESPTTTMGIVYHDLWLWWNYMNYNLSEPICVSPNAYPKRIKPDYEPGILNGKIYGKLGEWAKALLRTL